MIEAAFSAVLMNSVEFSTRVQEDRIDIGLTVSEAPIPRRYSLSTQTECGGVEYIVEIESGYAIRSRILRATADGLPISLIVGDEDLASLIETVRVIGLQPVVCGAQNPFLQIAVRSYDASLDAQPGHDGEVLLIATAVDR